MFLKMNTLFKERWPKLKQELVPLVLLSTIQVWWNFNFSLFVKLGTPWSTIVSIATSIMGTLVYVYVFAYADIIFGNDDSDYTMPPYAEAIQMAKTFQKIIIVGIVSFAMAYIWHKNLYSMSNLYYALFYTYCILGFVLIWRASHRKPS